MSQSLSLRIILHRPTANVDFGLQKGSGSKYETVQIQRYNSTDLIFDVPVIVKGDRTKDLSPLLAGLYVQGPAGAKFIYIDIGTAAGQKDTAWSRRLKIPLTGISWDMTEKVISSLGKGIVTIVLGTGKDGEPTCGTVKPFDGWYIKNV